MFPTRGFRIAAAAFILAVFVFTPELASAPETQKKTTNKKAAKGEKSSPSGSADTSPKAKPETSGSPDSGDSVRPEKLTKPTGTKTPADKKKT